MYTHSLVYSPFVCEDIVYRNRNVFTVTVNEMDLLLEM